MEEKEFLRGNLISLLGIRSFVPSRSLFLPAVDHFFSSFIYLFPLSFFLFSLPFPFPPSPPYLSPFLEDTRCTGSYLRITLRVVDCALNRKQKPAAKGNRFTKGEGRRGEREGKSRSRTIRQRRAHTRR